jgi:tetratricopeptide (TPR) repeat protein
MHAEVLFNEAERLMGTVSPEELRAAQCLRWEHDLADPNPHQLAWVAPKLLLAGDTDTYRRVCSRLIARLGDTDEPRTAYLVARLCTMAPDTVSDSARLVKLAERAVRANAMPHYLHTLGLAHYRAGQFDQAIEHLHKSIEGKWNANVANWLALAMAYQRLGRADEARKWFDQAARWMENPESLQSIHGHDSLFCQVLRREAETLLNLQSRPEP